MPVPTSFVQRLRLPATCSSLRWRSPATTSTSLSLLLHEVVTHKPASVPSCRSSDCDYVLHGQSVSESNPPGEWPTNRSHSYVRHTRTKRLALSWEHPREVLFMESLSSSRNRLLADLAR